MTSTLLIVQFVLAIIITITVLLQKSSSIGLGAYSGSNESLFGAKGPGNFLSKATMVLGLLFVINTIYLGYIYNQNKLESAVDNVKTESLIPSTPEKEKAPAAPLAPVAPVLPTEPAGK
ncbi:preprotein translocase subunit SecG [Halarcobacter ebronensis]|uniref:Protein-export membrane protein SecG n=1 Tax=Halarcobacter ebronensis TaxID=1462615 RepID=A0A4Q0Y7T1_9BACT|nr:preprotein translocase subunit SecG [Halarcobacter ebronensis]RXJ65943.1 preprotein translocase subunit SecG [Halarcobacter ebronensis]